MIVMVVVVVRSFHNMLLRVVVGVRGDVNDDDDKIHHGCGTGIIFLLCSVESKW